ncbi:methyltransferase [Scytonema hofmannii FACHB-248]|uniref:Methyltransferase n=1 Tax=Scytonema hofmannii FACHB-248 TaxID=1842502 RepID=A0ABR8GSY5_9CYAN|nr:MULTISPECIES: methyltransferase [Nostocales]MBD2606587.1 methyltransferase [Scytonema hofmannii FACHB-248]DAZ89845.1 TPA: CybD [Tolypothrix sp. PCC 9009]
MSQTASFTIKKPRTNVQPLWNIIYGDILKKVVLIAHDLKLFSLLAAQPRTFAEICSLLSIDPRPAQALLAVLASVELVQVKYDCYSLTLLAEDYLLESSLTYFGYILDGMIAQDNLYSFETIKKAVLSNSPQVYGHGELFKSHQEQEDLTRTFTYTMHSGSMASALLWPDVIDLSGHKLLLDIGGGSGAHAIGATLRWSNLQAIILDLPLVCEVAQEFVTRYGLQNRINTHMSDMWNDPFPEADLHFYGCIYHDWSLEKCGFLTQKSFESLESGGRIIIHEVLYNDLKTGPSMAAATDVGMLLWTEGQQYSGHELLVMLMEAGFTDVQVKSNFGYYSIVTGRKP